MVLSEWDGSNYVIQDFVTFPSQTTIGGGGVAIPPVLGSLSINGGTSSTSGGTVSLNHVWSGGAPTQYLASESPGFAGATWRTYASAPSFQLSSGAGTKTVYFKLRNADGESAVKQRNIDRRKGVCAIGFGSLSAPEL